MKEPKPIALQGLGKLRLRCIGYRNKNARPYLTVDQDQGPKESATHFGYIDDKDLKRLQRWVEDCLTKRK